MAKFRQVHTSFWQDPLILELEAEEKYFYLYLVTNTKTTACGIYELPLKLIELETGLNSNRINQLIERFEQLEKIRYCHDTKEVIILNWFKYNDFNSPNSLKCIQRELGEIKNPEFKAFIENYLKTKTTPCKGFIRGLQGATKPLASKQIQILDTDTKSSSLDQLTMFDIDSKNDDYDDDFKKITETLTNWGVNDISTIKKAYSVDEILQSIAMVEQYKPANAGAYLRTLLKNQAALKLDSCSTQKPTSRCEALQVIDSWKSEKACEKPSREQIINSLQAKGKFEEAQRLCGMWNITPKPT